MAYIKAWTGYSDSSSFLLVYLILIPQEQYKLMNLLFFFFLMHLQWQHRFFPSHSVKEGASSFHFIHCLSAFCLSQLCQHKSVVPIWWILMHRPAVGTVWLRIPCHTKVVASSKLFLTCVGGDGCSCSSKPCLRNACEVVIGVEMQSGAVWCLVDVRQWFFYYFTETFGAQNA